jgi:hypothetical protein
MTATITRTTTGLPVADEDDGCPAGNHRRDALCARTRIDTLTRKQGETS